MYKVLMEIELECDVASPEKALQEASYRLPNAYGSVKIIGCELSCHSYQQDMVDFNRVEAENDSGPVPVEPGEEVLL